MTSSWANKESRSCNGIGLSWALNQATFAAVSCRERTPSTEAALFKNGHYRWKGAAVVKSKVILRIEKSWGQRLENAACKRPKNRHLFVLVVEALHQESSDFIWQDRTSCLLSQKASDKLSYVTLANRYNENTKTDGKCIAWDVCSTAGIANGPFVVFEVTLPSVSILQWLYTQQSDTVHLISTTFVRKTNELNARKSLWWLLVGNCNLNLIFTTVLLFKNDQF